MTAIEINRDAEPLGPVAPPQSSLRSIGLVTSLTLGQLLLQFVLQLLLARYFGASQDMDAYVAALALPTVLATILAGSLGYVLVPIIAKLRASDREREAAATAVQWCFWISALAVAISAAVVAASAPLSRMLCPGFTVEEQRLTAGLLRVSSALIITNTLISCLNALFQAYQRFAAPAMAGVVGTLVTLGYVLLLHERQGIFAVAWGVVVGAATTACVLLPLFFEKWVEGGQAAWRAQPEAGRVLALLWPLVAASLLWRLDPLLDRYLGSGLPTGSLAHLGYAWRLINGLMLIGTSGLSVVAFPAIAAHAAAERRAELNAELAYAIRFFLVLMLPICIGVALFAQPVVRLLFEHGRFTATDTLAVAGMVALYVGAILGAGLGDLLSRAFYAQHDTLKPVVVSAAVFAIAVVLKFWLVRRQGGAGLVAATSAYYLLNAGVLLVLLARRQSIGILAGTGGAMLRAVAGSAVGCVVAAIVLCLPVAWVVLPAAVSAGAAYVGAMWLFGDEFVMKLWRFLSQRSHASA